MKILVIIPCYNEQDNIDKVIRNLKATNSDVDYVIINDCSTDNSKQVCENNNLNYVSFPFNLGIGGSVQCGYQYAVERGYDIAVQMDGDGQHNPEYLIDILEPILSGKADMCIGSRFINKEGFQSSKLRRLGIAIISLVILALTGKRVRDVTSGFRACSKNLINFYSKEYAQDFPEPEAILSAVKNGFKVVEVPVVMEERFAGISSINALKSPYFMVKVILSLIVGWLKY